MQIDTDDRTLDELTVDFCDEDTDTWTRAAMVIGRRAADDAACREFIQRRLAEAPGAAQVRSETASYQTTGLHRGDEDAPRVNVHRFRHACCALAGYLSVPDTQAEPFGEVLERYVRQPLVTLCLSALQSQGGTVGQLKQIPGLADRFETWRQRQIAGRRANITKFTRSRNRRALEANREQLAALEALTDESPIPPAFKGPARRTGEDAEWALACYFAGLGAEKALLGFPLPLLVRSLLHAAATGGAAGLPFVLSLPNMLQRIQPDVRKAAWSEAAVLLYENVRPAWMQAHDAYNQYVVALAQLRGAPAFRTLWLQGLRLPDWLAAQLTSLEELARKPAGADEARRLACRMMRTIAERTFRDDWYWKELSAEEQFALNVYTLLMVYGPGPLALGRRGFGPADGQGSLPKLPHRISLLLDGIQACKRARSTVLPPLVRCLKLLLRGEMAESSLRKLPKGDSPLRAEALDDLMALCRRQLLIVRPLLADWLLPTTLRKDLATIVCRVLHKVRRQQERYGAAPQPKRSEHREYVVELVYIMLFAFPDKLLLREMIEYSTDDDICRLLDCIRRLIAQLDAHDPAHVKATSAADRTAHFEIIADAWQDRYRDFTDLLRKISLHEAAASDADRWIDRLPAMVRHLTRAGRRDAPGQGDPQQPLQPLLLYGQKSGQDWRVLLDESQGRRKDRAGAADEQGEQTGREHLAARLIAGRFDEILDDIAILENDCLPEAGRPRMGSDLVPRWRRLIGRLHELSRLCREELPGLERRLCSLLIQFRINHVLEPRLHRIVEIVEQEREADACEALKRQVGVLRAEGEQAFSARKATQDIGLIQDWMLQRYMIRELAESYGLRVLMKLTDSRFVLCWIAFPFVACAILHLLKLGAWGGVPFALTFLANVGLILAFAVESRRCLPRLETLKISPWRFLLPQTTAAIFLAIFSSIPSDERWSLAIRSHPLVQVVTWAIFLIIGFIFTREVLLGRQFRGKKQAKQKSRRAGQLMALSLWQSFALVLFFTMATGRIMAGSDRGNINPEEFSGLGRIIGYVLPIEVYLGHGFLNPATSREAASFWIYPRALISWTIQVFFFGAIFERIMGRSER